MKLIKIKLLKPANTDIQILKRLKKYGDFYNFYLLWRKNIITLNKVKKWIISGQKIVLGDINNPRFIKCNLSYSDLWDDTILYVKCSNHPRFIPNIRFDYGFMLCALMDRYCISYNFK